MREDCLASLTAILQDRPADLPRLETVWDEAAREPITLAAGNTIRADAALLHYRQLRPAVRLRVDQWLADRFAPVEMTRDDASPAKEETSVPPPVSEESGVEPEPVKDSRIRPGKTGADPDDSSETTPRRSLPPGGPTRFETDPFDRFLDWVSSLLGFIR
jgi:hypothetical protein